MTIEIKNGIVLSSFMSASLSLSLPLLLKIIKRSIGEKKPRSNARRIRIILLSKSVSSANAK